MNRAFRRKIGYLIAIVVLLIPLSALSLPQTAGRDGAAEGSGGVLAKLRAEKNLSQANLGQIDPSSETLKLAMLGMRGVAANVLWNKVIEAKKTEDWSTFEATLNQITNLQPNYQSVWYFQAWNISYNISVEFDDYRDRYHWVMRGVDYLKRGIGYNQKDPELRHQVGWFLKNKIGRADERKQFRRLFREDKDFHGDRPIRERDNFLVAKEWFLAAEQTVDRYKRRIERRSPLVFYSERPQCQSNYAMALAEGDDQQDAVFGEVARIAWSRAEQDWNEFGNRELPARGGIALRLNDLERVQGQILEGNQRLDGLAPGTFERLTKKHYERLTPDEREAMQTPPDRRRFEQRDIADEAARKMYITPNELAAAVAEARPEETANAQRLAVELSTLYSIAQALENGRSILNFDFWLSQCEAERTADALDAREAFFLADRAWQEDLNMPRARRLYEQGFQRWLLVARNFPRMAHDDRTIDDLFPAVQGYDNLLDSANERLAKDFPLRYVAERYYEMYPDKKPRRAGE